jgi:hypothetical protein
MRGAVVILIGGGVIIAWGWLWRAVTAQPADDDYTRVGRWLGRILVPAGVVVVVIGLVVLLGSILEQQ